MILSPDRKLQKILEKEYEESLKNFIPEFGNLKHIEANKLSCKIKKLKKKKKKSEAEYKKLSSLISNFLFVIK